MAEKKPSKNSDRGTIGSAEELDAYGVWVKSEPQDLTASMAEAVNFDTEAVPYADFDMEFDDTEESSFDFADLEPVIPEISVEDDDNDNFDVGITASAAERGGEEASTQLLMKIADELSAIRLELSTLKKEFAGVRIESAPGVKTAGVTAEARHGGFFDGEEGDDEKITLTGDEMENILTSADFSAEEGIGFDARREADEAALKELSEQNESATETEEEEEIAIDFDNLGINLDDDIEAEALDEFPPLEAGIDDDFETSSLDALSLEEIPPLEEIPSEEMPSEEMQEELMPLESLKEEDDEELQDLRREGAIPFTPAPDNSMYLETDPFALDDSGLEEIPLGETSFDETALEEPALDDSGLGEISLGETSFDETTLEEPALDDSGFEEISLGETSFDETALEEIALEEPALEDTAIEETTLDEPALAESGLTETVSPDTASEITADLSFDETSFDLDADDFSIDESLPPPEEEIVEEQTAEQTFESPAPIEEEISDEPVFDTDLDLSAESLSPFEEETGDLDISTESEISIEQTFESPVSLGDEISIEQTFESPAPIEEEISDEPVFDTSLDLSAESLSPFEEETGDLDISAESEISIGETFESPAPIEEEISDEPVFDTGLDLSEAVIDEPDLSAGLVEAPLEEPVLGDISFGDDISLDMDDFGSGIDIDTGAELGAEEDLGLADDLAMDDVETGDSGLGGDIVMDESIGLDTEADDSVESLAVDIDTGAEEDLGLAEDLAMDDVETGIELDMGADGLVMDETGIELDAGDIGPAGGLAGGLTDDLAGDLALDDFDAGIDLDVKEEDGGLAGGPAGSLADDGLTGIIPEGFEINAEEAPISVDDDLEAFDEGEISLPQASAAKTAGADADEDIDIPANFKSELKSVLSYMDRLLESLPEDKIEEFAKSEYFDSYKKIFKELGLV
ncbi:MAG: hypothetical protein LBB89_06830 [Treponema sp.]|jgi:hypothetical protein|nr:hypothetical protein [Treponema sp.]